MLNAIQRGRPSGGARNVGSDERHPFRELLEALRRPEQRPPPAVWNLYSGVAPPDEVHELSNFPAASAHQDEEAQPSVQASTVKEVRDIVAGIISLHEQRHAAH